MKSYLILPAIVFTTLSLIVESTMFNEQIQQEIVDAINTIRQGVSPPAADMREIQWSNCLAAVANDYLHRCDGPTRNPGRLTEAQNRGCNASEFSVGENIYSTSGILVSSTAAIDSWGAQSLVYTYPSACSDKCLDYFQLIWSSTSQVGCAFLDLSTGCTSGTGTLVICDFAEGSIPPISPYTEGAACSACTAPFFGCNNGLCAIPPPTTQPTTPTTSPTTSPTTNPVTNATTNPVTNATTNPVTNATTNPVTNPTTNATAPVTAATSEPIEGATPTSNASSLQILFALVYASIFAITFAF